MPNRIENFTYWLTTGALTLAIAMEGMYWVSSTSQRQKLTATDPVVFMPIDQPPNELHLKFGNRACNTYLGLETIDLLLDTPTSTIQKTIYVNPQTGFEGKVLVNQQQIDAIQVSPNPTCRRISPAGQYIKSALHIFASR